MEIDTKSIALNEEITLIGIRCKESSFGSVWFDERMVSEVKEKGFQERGKGTKERKNSQWL